MENKHRTSRSLEWMMVIDEWTVKTWNERLRALHSHASWKDALRKMEWSVEKRWESIRLYGQYKNGVDDGAVWSDNPFEMYCSNCGANNK